MIWVNLKQIALYFHYIGKSQVIGQGCARQQGKVIDKNERTVF